MEKLTHYVLPENTNDLYKKEAISSIALTKDVADKINELVDAFNSLFAEDLLWKQTQEGIIRKGVIYMKDNLVNSLTDLLKMYRGDILNRFLNLYGEELRQLKVFVTPQMYGATGDGIADETDKIQTAINEANKKGRVVYIPRGNYKISKSLILNGCTLIGDPGNVFHSAGTVLECASKDFTAISQGSTNTEDIMFGLSNIVVKNADTAFEIVYAINSKFERLYAVDCNLGFQLGSPDSVGSMFCEFNNLYTNNCRKGVAVNSDQYFNNNRFNNGFLQGSEVAMTMEVIGGYGAIDNVFNNVEFRSEKGRGIELTSALNTDFNNCYFECGGNVLRTNNYCTVTMYNCIYGSFTFDNTNVDVNMVYSVGGSAFTFNGGTIFLSENYVGKYFFGTGNEAVYQNVTVDRAIRKNGSASGFDFFAQSVKTTLYQAEEQVTLTGTVTVEGNSSLEVPFTYSKAFTSVPTVVLYTMRGSSGAGLTTIVTERTATGGTLKVHNSTSSAISVSFSVYAKLI